MDAGFAMSTYPIAGLAGAILSGIISDKLFKGSCICDYSDAMVDRYLRTLIIRGNFYYHQKVQARQRVGQVFDDLDRLIAERERNQIFDHLIWHICAVEQVEDRGYHIHAAFFFNGNEVWADASTRPGRLVSCGNALLGGRATSTAATTTRKKSTVRRKRKRQRTSANWV